MRFEKCKHCALDIWQPKNSRMWRHVSTRLHHCGNGASEFTASPMRFPQKAKKR